jgi:hypothetical protein
MARELNCPQCGQLFSARPTKCPHCGLRFCRFLDQGRLSDLIPGFRRLPKQVRIGIVIFAMFCLLCYFVDMPEHFDKLHRFMSRKTSVPAWMRIKK